VKVFALTVMLVADRPQAQYQRYRADLQRLQLQQYLDFALRGRLQHSPWTTPVNVCRKVGLSQKHKIKKVEKQKGNQNF
jgi:hypothetical protein